MTHEPIAPEYPAVSLDVCVRLDVSKLGTLTPEQTEALMHGIAQVISAGDGTNPSKPVLNAAKPTTGDERAT